MLVDAPFRPQDALRPRRTAAAPVVPGAVTRDDAQEDARHRAARTIERLTLIIFWLLILEGSLRKWVAPHYSHLLFFVRDPFVLLLYWQALRSGAFKGAGPWFVIGLAFAAIAPLLALAQVVTIGDFRIATVIAYGWRQYFLYLPLPFALASVASEEFLWRFARHAILATALTAPLMFVQFHSPAGAVINRGTAEDEALQFKSFDLYDGRIRPSGFFTSNVGVVNLVPSTLALVFAAWLTPADRRRIRMRTLVLAAAATASCLALSGARGAFASVALVVLASFLVGTVVAQPSIRARALLVPTALFALGAVLYPVLFPEAFSTMAQRVAAAGPIGPGGAGQGMLGRVIAGATDFIPLMERAPLIGYGLGLGGNGRTFLGQESGQLMQDVYAESDWSRHMVDLGPIVGLLFILYRIGLTASLFRRCLLASARFADPFPLMIFGYVGIGVFYGQLTGHGTVGGFTWLYLGLALASCRIARERDSGETVATAAPSRGLLAS